MFIRNPEKNFGELDPRAKKCIFVGYAPSQKGYKCFDPKTKNMFITMDTIIFKHKPFFMTHLQGENLGRKIHIWWFQVQV